MTCQRRGGISITVSAVQIRINQAYMHYRNIYDTCDETLGMLALAGCISQAPSYASVTDACDELWGLYPLAGCQSYVAVIPDAFSGEPYGLTPIGEE